jgi:hypothetical protein
MNQAIEILHKSVPALLVALSLIVLKRGAERRRPALDDTNDVAWTLIMMSIGGLAVYARQCTTVELEATASCVVLLAVVLLVNRSRKLRFRTRAATKDPSTSFRIVEACTELAIGLAAFVITTR